MAQAVILQAEILAKDVSAIDVLWIDALKNQERFQLSYSSKIHELFEAVKRRQTFSAGEIVSLEPKIHEEVADYKYNRDVNNGLA